MAFSGETNEDTLSLVRSLRNSNVQIDIVPRLFEAVGLNAGIHAIEGLPLGRAAIPADQPHVAVGQARHRHRRSRRLLLVLVAPLLLYIAIRDPERLAGPDLVPAGAARA